ncbi:hypothetical protein E2562_004824 [Oryza meyeriana var. granulata]|uniref:Glycosyltransferase n=1 Tax=Oryza meyeriana var. granulata TaxID=110450 RepID=A0A6G1DDI0_9ORYZ|nr:hypothetical protein E2562_004824 [Oryza meyeriana var. granulata]
MQSSEEENAAPRIYFIPFPTPGHALPMSDLARLFASRGADATLVLTRANAARLGGPVARAAAAGLRIRVHALTLPAEAAGLTGGHESADDLPSRELAGPFAVAVDLLAPLFADLLRRRPADAVVFDGVLPWAATAAPELRIPRYAFTGTGCFALSVQRALLLHAPQDSVASADEPFLVPGLPDAVRLTKSRLAEATLPGAHSREFLNRMFDGERATAGWVVNSFADLEQKYIGHYEKETGKPVFAVGPVCLVNGDGDDVLERGRGGEACAATDAARVLTWLDTKPARSVVYVCFGSLTRFPREQVAELGMGLAGSGVSFVWVVGEKKASASLPDIDTAVSAGRGLVITGWAPQVAVLRHAAVGAFVTHCGWGAVTEAAAAGVPVLAWPVFAEQFYNEALVVGLAGTGVGVGAERGYVWGGEESGGVVVGRETVAERVRAAMADNGLRQRAEEVGERARRAVEMGGSSYDAVGALLYDVLRRRRELAAEPGNLFKV